MHDGLLTSDPPRRIALGIPWHLPFYKRLNGAHPLVESFVKDNPYVRAVPCTPTASRSGAQLAELLPALCERTRFLTEVQRGDYVPWIDPFEQASIDQQADRFDAIFAHTTPTYLGMRPWIFHFESVPSLFHPILTTGDMRGKALREHGLFHAVTHALAGANCRAIITHMRSSRDILQRLLPAPQIAGKLHYVPLGVDTLDDATALAKFRADGPLRILFTNSLHQNPISFFLRGGHHLLRAFAQLRDAGVAVELTIISAAAEGSGLPIAGDGTDGLTWIKERVSDALLEQLLREHHVFALPAAGLHSYSLLRALSHGCVPIVSDALGYEEYTRDIADSVFTVRGVRDLVYRDEPGGWISDQYGPYIEASADLVPQLYRAIWAAQDKAALLQMAWRNLQHCRRQHEPAACQRAFAACLGTHFPDAAQPAPEHGAPHNQLALA